MNFKRGAWGESQGKAATGSLRAQRHATIDWRGALPCSLSFKRNMFLAAGEGRKTYESQTRSIIKV